MNMMMANINNSIGEFTICQNNPVKAYIIFQISVYQNICNLPWSLMKNNAHFVT